MQMDENKKVLHHIQLELNHQKSQGGKFTSEELKRIQAHQEMMKDLKDPFL